MLVVGLGRLGTTFVAALRSWGQSGTIVAVDRDIQRAALDQLRHQHRLRIIRGDARIAGTFASLAIEHARGVALLTEDDLLNLDVAFRLAKEHPEIPILAHVSDISLQRAAADVEAHGARGRLHVFNGHRVTAEHLFSNHLREYFEATHSKDTVVLAGFGRFGQTIFELLQQEASGEIDRLLIADRAAALAWRTFESEVSCDTRSVPITIDGDLTDPQTWQRIVIGSDSDSANLQSALAVRRWWPSCKTFVRFQNHSEFAEALAQRHRFVVLGVDTMLVRALAEQQRIWFPEEP
jgi:voltage-gated potassium channel Kch